MALDLGVADAINEGLLRALVNAWPIWAGLGVLIVIRIGFLVMAARFRRHRRRRLVLWAQSLRPYAVWPHHLVVLVLYDVAVPHVEAG